MIPDPGTATTSRGSLRAADPAKDDDFIVLEAEPLNGAPSAERLGASFVTPASSFFVRGHGAIPQVDADLHRLRVHGLVRRPLELSIDELRAAFPWREMAATLQCAGNRRAELAAVAPTSSHLKWRAHAIGNGVWGGVSLADLLARADPLPGAAHVGFEGLDRAADGEDGTTFGGSIPIDKARSPETLIALELDGAPLPAEHGFPIRAVVPGYIGARSVKWLAAVEVLAAPSANRFHARDYRMRTAADVESGSAGAALGETLVNAAILDPGEGTAVAAGIQTVRGYATGSHGREVELVEVTADGGRTWTRARLTGGGRWTWVQWEADVPIGRGCTDIAVRASDGVQAQPEDLGAVWNLAGYMNNAWHRVPVTVR